MYWSLSPILSLFQHTVSTISLDSETWHGLEIGFYIVPHHWRIRLGHLKNTPPSKIQWGRALFFFLQSNNFILYSSTESGITQLFKKWPSQLARIMFLYHHLKSVSQNLKTKKNFMDKFVPCFFFHSKLFKTLLVIHFLYSKNKKKSNCAGKKQGVHWW